MGSVFKVRVDADGRECNGCSEYKAWDDYTRVTSSSTGHATKCKLCSTQRPEYMRQYNLLKNYGLTVEQYEKLLAAQGGVCALCARPERAVHQSGRLKLLAVDHDRRCCPGDKSCGQCVRGLLCFSCNVTLGKLESRGLAQKMAAYLDARPHR